jgi:hypothetical protein
MIVSEEPMPVLIERVSGVSPEQGTVAQAYANPTPANITAEHKLLTVSAPKQERERPVPADSERRRSARALDDPAEDNHDHGLGHSPARIVLLSTCDGAAVFRVM